MLIVAFFLACAALGFIAHPLTGLYVLAGLVVLFILYCIYDSLL